MRKGILIIGSYPPPFGGVSSHIQYLSDYLISRDYNVHVFSSKIGRKDVKNLTVYEKPSKREIFLAVLRAVLHFPESSKMVFKLKAIGLSDWKEILRIAILVYIFEGIVNRDKNIKLISAYHLLPDGLIGVLLSEKFGIPLVVTNFGEIYTNPDFYKKILSAIEYILKSSSKVLSCSQHCAKSYNLIGLRPDIEVIPYGIDVKHFSSESHAKNVCKTLGISKQDKVVIFVGRMIKDMGLHTLLEAIPLVLKSQPDIKFIIAGAKGELSDAAFKLQAEYKNNIFVVQNASFNELPDLYNISTIAVAPTPDERACMGMAIKEAMAASKPVIAARSGGIPEAVINSETGILVEPENPKFLSLEILKLINDKDAILKMGESGRKRAESLFDKDISNQKIYKIFQDIINEKQ